MNCGEPCRRTTRRASAVPTLFEPDCPRVGAPHVASWSRSLRSCRLLVAETLGRELAEVPQTRSTMSAIPQPSGAQRVRPRAASARAGATALSVR